LNLPKQLSTPLEVFTHWEKTTPQNILFQQPINDQWKKWTYDEAGNEIRRIASALQAYNLPPKSNIAILSKNCAHWIMADLAIWMAGHVSVPIYPTLSSETIQHILKHSGSKVLFIGKLDTFDQQRQGIPQGIKCISFTLYGEKEGESWDDLIRIHQPVKEPVAAKPEELATIIYTSGTTGTPKGVMISFDALHYVTTHGLGGFNIRPGGQRFFSYLPLSHIAERMLVEMGGIYSGAAIHFSESLEKFPDNLMDTRPTIFLAVPRIWTKFREKIEEKMPKLDTLLKIPLVNTIIKKAIRKKLGLSKAAWVLTGAAPISPALLQWFKKIDINICDVYGMTENLTYSHSNAREIKHGTVGQAWPDVSVKFSEQDEIQMKHPGMMLGYYRELEMTASVFTQDGFFKTGDKGEVDAAGFLTITGRIKDQFKTDKAKFVDPAPIELKLMSNKDIEQVCIVGVGIPQPIALMVLSATAKAKEKEAVNVEITKTIQEINQHLESYERIKTAVILREDWTVENGLMTPTMKVKRNEVEKIHFEKYPYWYEQKANVVWE
jgi:long-chain acyl-CoA synthetase